MENELVAELVLSGPLPDGAEGEAIVRPLAEEAMQRVLGPKANGKVSAIHVGGERIVLTFSSDGARPHQSFLAFVRRLQESIGKSRKIGVRSFRAIRYTVEFPLDPAPLGPVVLPLPNELTYEDGRATLALPELPEEALRDNWVDRIIALVQEKVRRQAYAGKEQYWSLMKQSPPREHAFTADPTEAMLAKHWVRNGPTKGKWFLGPRATHVLRAMERIARTEVLDPLGFQEVIQPHHDSFDILLKTGHLEGLPGEFYYVAEPRTRDPKEWERFTDLVKITREVPQDELAKLVSPPSAVSCYAQCPTIYWWLSGRTIAETSLPVKVYDKTAISNRYESGGRHGL
jgi:seryl-tRNA synthetase